eukprot:4330075-Pleurochrysis_carterae.AAC.1
MLLIFHSRLRIARSTALARLRSVAGRPSPSRPSHRSASGERSSPLRRPNSTCSTSDYFRALWETPVRCTATAVPLRACC